MGNTLLLLAKIVYDFVSLDPSTKFFTLFDEIEDPIKTIKTNQIALSNIKDEQVVEKVQECLKIVRQFKLHKDIDISESSGKIFWRTTTNRSQNKIDFSIENQIKKCRINTLSSYTSNSISLLTTGELVSSSLEANKYTIKFWNIIKGSLKCVKVNFLISKLILYLC
jgi:hypothetical protein